MDNERYIKGLIKLYNKLDKMISEHEDIATSYDEWGNTERAEYARIRAASYREVRKLIEENLPIA